MKNINIDMSKLQRDTLTNFVNSYFPDITLVVTGVALFSLLTMAKPSIGTTLFLAYHASCRLLLAYSDIIQNSNLLKSTAIIIEIIGSGGLRKSIEALKNNTIMNRLALKLRFIEINNKDPRYKVILIDNCTKINDLLKINPTTHSKVIALAAIIVNRGIIIGYAGYATLNTALTLRYILSYVDKSSYLFDATMCLIVAGTTVNLMQKISKKDIKKISAKLLMPFYKETLDVDQRNCDPVITAEMQEFMHAFTNEIREKDREERDEGYFSDSSIGSK